MSSMKRPGVTLTRVMSFSPIHVVHTARTIVRSTEVPTLPTSPKVQVPSGARFCGSLVRPRRLR